MYSILRWLCLPERVLEELGAQHQRRRGSCRQGEHKVRESVKKLNFVGDMFLIKGGGVGVGPPPAKKSFSDKM